MSEPEPLAPLLTALRDLLAWWQAGPFRGLIIGGVAASLLGRPRATRDVDALVLLAEEHWSDFLNRGASFGFLPRLADPLALARQARVLLVRHLPSGIDVDIAFGILPFEEETLDRAMYVPVGSFTVPVPTPEDLIIMKAVAHRPRDLADIESVLDAHPKLNLRRIHRWVREFANALEQPELLEDLEALLTRWRKRNKRRSR